MDEYPNSDEEFELMHGDEFELLKELDEPDRPKSRKSLDFETPKSKSNSKHLSTQAQNEDLDAIVISNDSFDNDFSRINASLTEDTHPDYSKGEGKRTVQDLFGDIDDILDDDLSSQNVAKKQKTDLAADLELIDRIVELRKLSKQKQNSAILLSSHVVLSEDERNRNNISYSVPRYSFMAVTRNDKERVYVRMHNKLYMQEVSAVLINDCTTGVMGDGFKETWKTVRANLEKKRQQMETESVCTPNTPNRIHDPNATQLWVEMYKPRKYLELLSDEGTNRIMLRWLKLWDKVVFNRKPKPKINKLNDQKTPVNKFQWKQEQNLKLAQDGRPEFKVALLCGPPGLGKTTLAHILAQHAGYNIVEINASDERTTDSFKNALETATQMRSIVDPDNRPNCLIFDEIDGAPAASIDLLVKYVTGTAKAKATKKGQKQKAHVLKRPIICICNDVYVPALRPLRQIAFVVNFPPTVPTRLAERLVNISKYQMLKTDLGALLALCAKTHNDIRSCLSVLQFFKVNGRPLTLSEVYKASIGQMDMHKGLFEVWQDIFQISKMRPEEKTPVLVDEEGNATVEKPNSLLKFRMDKILSTVQAFGDYERLMQGVYENYPKMKMKESSLQGNCEALEWFCLSDIFNHYIHSTQNYSLGAYLPYAFVVWHFTYATFAWQKINYPSVGYEVRTKIQRNQTLVTEVLRGMSPSTRAHVNGNALKLDLLPMISQIIVPSFRPVNLHLYTAKEREELLNVVNIMIDYNLNYIQERNAEGAYEFNIEPNIEQLICVGGSLGDAMGSGTTGSSFNKNFGGPQNRRVLSYSNKQLIAREIELEKMRRIEIGKDRNAVAKFGDGQNSGDAGKKTDAAKAAIAKKGPNAAAQIPHIPNHLQRLQPKKVKPLTTVTKDFFGRIITKTSPEQEKSGPQMGNDIWFCYKEGYNNAVRKTIKIKNLK